MAERKRDIRELVGVAVNSSALRPGGLGETVLDRIGALGAASLAVKLGADIDDAPIAGAKSLVYHTQPDPRDVLAGELSPLLWHIRYGGQHEQVPYAVALFAAWMGWRRVISEAKPAIPPQRLMRLSARVLHEWLSDRCMACGGSGKQERSKEGRWIRPVGRMQRNAYFRGCRVCGGLGRALPRHAERWRELDLTRHEYDAGRWPQRFKAALVWLHINISRLYRPLTTELERSKRRT